MKKGEAVYTNVNLPRLAIIGFELCRPLGYANPRFEQLEMATILVAMILENYKTIDLFNLSALLLMELSIVGLKFASLTMLIVYLLFLVGIAVCLLFFCFVGTTATAAN